MVIAEKSEWGSVDAEAATSDPSLDRQANEDSRENLENDPFGNEENKDVKYKTMKWW